MKGLSLLGFASPTGGGEGSTAAVSVPCRSGALVSGSDLPPRHPLGPPEGENEPTAIALLLPHYMQDVSRSLQIDLPASAPRKHQHLLPNVCVSDRGRERKRENQFFSGTNNMCKSKTSPIPMYMWVGTRKDSKKVRINQLSRLAGKEILETTDMAEI